MRIAFHTPLNPPDDGAISGDRRMAAQLLAALRKLGHEVETIAGARCYMGEPDPAMLARYQAQAVERRRMLLRQWRDGGAAPDLWFTYHPYYKSPDLLGPDLCDALALPYVAAEASDTARRAAGPWAEQVALTRRALLRADIHFVLTARDRAGLRALLPDPAALVDLPPFLGEETLAALVELSAAGQGPLRLITVAMMREGVKLESYRSLAGALEKIAGVPWTLTIVGDGAARPSVAQAFASLDDRRIVWRGALPHAAIMPLLAEHDVFVWPGIGEGYGLVYLEAQAAGLPVVAYDSGGVAATVLPGQTAFLLPERDETALAAAVTKFHQDRDLLRGMGQAARRFALTERTPVQAAAIVGKGLALAKERFRSRRVTLLAQAPA